MGKRKTAKKQMKKEKRVVMSKFDCPFCNHAGSIKIVIMKKAKIGQCKCTVCNESYETEVAALTEPIDLYCEWIDECEKLNEKDESVEPSSRQGGRGRGGGAASRRHEDDEDDEDEEGGGVGGGADDDDDDDDDD